MSSARSTYGRPDSGSAPDPAGADPVTLDPPVAFHAVESLYRGTPQSGDPARPRHYEPPLRPPTGVEGYGWLFRPEGASSRHAGGARRTTVDEDTMPWSLDPEPAAIRPVGVPLHAQPPSPAAVAPDSSDELPQPEPEPLPEREFALAAEEVAAGGRRRRSRLLGAGLVSVTALAPALVLLTLWF